MVLLIAERLRHYRKKRELGQETDLQKFWDAVNGKYDHPAETLELCRRYYRKYPDNYAVMNQIGWILTSNKDLLPNEMPLLREVYEKSLTDAQISTTVRMRRNICAPSAKTAS